MSDRAGALFLVAGIVAVSIIIGAVFGSWIGDIVFGIAWLAVVLVNVIAGR